jgi:pilus assembly protein CpaF
MVNGPRNIYIERNGKIHKVESAFLNDEHVMRVIDRIITPMGRRIDETSPRVDARLPDGSRVNAIVEPLSLVGPVITVRKFAAKPYTVDDLIRFGTATPEMFEFLRACIEARLNLFVSGGTGSGKTTTLNVLSSFIPNDERIVTIEDAAELRLQQPHVVRLESRPASVEGRGEVTIRDLLRNALRMRPDRIVIGEVRGPEALDLLTALNTGHEGALSTVHANSARDALARLETLALMAGVGLPHESIAEQVRRGVDLVVHLERRADGGRRVTEIAAVE